MSEVTIRQPAMLFDAPHFFGRYQWLFAHGEDWRQVFLPRWWEHCAHRRRAGDTIEFHTADHRVQFTVHLTLVNDLVSPPTIEAFARPIYPIDLKLPTAGICTHASHAGHVVQSMSGARRFEVRDAAGVVIADGLERDQALDRAAALDMAAQAAAAGAVLAEALSGPQPLPHTRVREAPGQIDQLPIDWQKKTEEAGAAKGRPRR